MYGLEAVLAAVGGLFLGLGIGVGWARWRPDHALEELHRIDAELHEVAIPILRAHLNALYGGADARLPDETSIDETLRLLRTLEFHEQREQIAFSDTMEVNLDSSSALTALESLRRRR